MTPRNGVADTFHRVILWYPTTSLHGVITQKTIIWIYVKRKSYKINVIT